MQKIKQLLSKLNKIQFIVISVVVAIVLIFVITFAIFKSNTSAISVKSEEVIYEVMSGDTLDIITSSLEKKSIIKSATFSKLSAKLNGIDGFVVGQYRVNKNWNSDKILKYLTNQKNVLRNEVMITFREGIWAKEIAGLLSEKIDNIKTEDVLNLWNNEEFLKKCIKKYDFLDESILNNEYRVKLEGYLFPETYSFYKDANLEDITFTFLDHFQNEYDKVKKSLKKKGMSVHDLITLSSVVQYESKSKEDMNMIAGVFFNRLKNEMPLQSSVTVCYAMYEYDSWEECELNTDIASPYNTYQNVGLPIGPILNPGADAIDSVLNSKENEYLYFIADINNVRGEGAGKVYYSKTIEEHLKLQGELGLSW